MDEFPNNLIPYRNWKNNSRNYYLKRVTITVPYEEYVPSPNNSEVNSINFVTTQKRFRVRNSEGWEVHSLLQEDRYSDILFLREENYLIYSSYRRNYESAKKRARLIGEVPPEFRFCLFKSGSDIDQIDKTNTIPKKLTTREIQQNTENRILEEGEFILTIKDYNELQIPLTPTFPFHLQKSVYFSHETQYIPKDKYCPPSKATQPISTLIYVNSKLGIGNVSRGNHELTKPGKLQSILKTRTQQGNHLLLEWISRLEFINSERFGKYGPHIRKVLYFKLLKNQPNWENFITEIETKKLVLHSDSELDHRITTKYQYPIKQSFRHELINKTILARVTNRIAVNKILKEWRFYLNRP
jgi:hypothetical protein